IAEAQVLQAGLLPNPELTTGFDFPVTTEVKAGYGFGLSWEVTSLLQRAAHQDAASAHAGAVDLEVAWQEWQVAQAARMHVLRLAILKGEVAAAAAVAENLRANLELVRRALELGGASALDVAAAETAHLQAETSHLGLEQEERS